MIGDTLSSDIKFGNDAQLGNGHGTLLVLSGVTTEPELKELIASTNHQHGDDLLVPQFYCDSLTKLYELFT